MRTLVATLAIAIAIGTLPLAAWAWQAQAAVDVPDNPLRGRGLLERKQCLTCHSLVDGVGIGPSLGRGRFSGTFLELGAALWNHVPGMKVTVESAGLEWPDLSGRETTELIAFLYFIDYLGQPGDPEAGSGVFQRGGCSSCHGVGGDRDGLGPDLGDLDRFASPLYLAQQIWNHGPSMLESIRHSGMQPPRFAAGDLADLSAFIRQQARARPRARTLLAPGNPNAGAGLFSAKGCAQCHGTSARGGRGGPDLAELDLRQSAEAIAGRMWNHALGMRDAMRARGVDWPQFEDSELAHLVAFLYFIPFADAPGSADRGAGLFESRLCSTCHGEGGDQVHADELLGGARSSASFVASMWNHAPAMLRAVLSEGQPWPELSGSELHDLYAYLHREGADAGRP